MPRPSSDFPLLTANPRSSSKLPLVETLFSTGAKMSMKLLDHLKSSIKRAKRGYVFKQSSWGLAEDSAPMQGVEAGAPSPGSDPPPPVLQTQEFEHIMLSQTGKAVRTLVPGASRASSTAQGNADHVDDITDGCLDTTSTSDFHTFLPPSSKPAPPASEVSPQKQNHRKGKKHSLLPYEFSVSRFDDNNVLIETTAADGAGTPRRKRPTPATVRPTRRSDTNI